MYVSWGASPTPVWLIINVRSMRWIRRRGDPVRIATGKYDGHKGTVESNVYQRTVDYPDEWANGHHEELATPST